MLTFRQSRPLQLFAIWAGFLIVLWCTLLISPGWIPINVKALTFGLCTPAVWEIADQNSARTLRYVESPNSVAFILGLLSLSAAAVYSAARKLFWSSPHEDIPEAQRRIIAKIHSDGLRLDRELGANIKYIQKFLDANDDYIRALEETRQKLEASLKLDLANKVISFLLARNYDMQSEANDLKRRLTQSQKQVQELRTQLSAAIDLSMRDPLTNLGNRRRFDMTMRREIAQARLEGSPLSLVICDLDNFKRINDSFGHQVGDRILQLFANTLGKNIRGRDTAIRFGGEEFALILPETDIVGARQLIENIRLGLGAANWRLTNTLEPIGTITASFGVAEYEHHESLQQLVQKTDYRLYLAKRNGRNRVEHTGDPEGTRDPRQFSKPP